MSSLTVTTWYLEQTAPGDLAPAAEPPAAQGVRIVRAERPLPEFSRFLYSAVGGDILWTDRLGWPYARWAEYLSQPGVETWVAYVHGTPAGFIELDGRADGVTEIAYFGLIPAFRGQGVGGHLLSSGTARAWDLGERYEGRPPTRRVWVHTCSKDGRHALRNYERRGFRLYDTTVEQEAVTETPGPWPGAGDTALPVWEGAPRPV
ncbi:GNAT family N-acetyltransferase [Streptomyces catenulae]|uniref:GNAT family N-acetyltransferase n=1 Tax=Streptomyces catenulae TaxID=66875 RepID=A0ABV2Z4Y1_9ACTN|nr:GNAT family N-acetyltransferase [Streptomyces catenulae]